MEISDKYACQIHGIIISDSDSDFESTKDLDEEYNSLKPPPLEYESIRDKIVVISRCQDTKNEQETVIETTNKKKESKQEDQLENAKGTNININNIKPNQNKENIASVDIQPSKVSKNAVLVSSAEKKSKITTQSQTDNSLSVKCVSVPHCNDHLQIQKDNVSNISKKKKKKKKRKKKSQQDQVILSESGNISSTKSVTASKKKKLKNKLQSQVDLSVSETEKPSVDISSDTPQSTCENFPHSHSEICEIHSALRTIEDKLHEIKKIWQSEFNCEQNIQYEIESDSFNVEQIMLELSSSVDSLHKWYETAERSNVGQNHEENSSERCNVGQKENSPEGCKTETESSPTCKINNAARTHENSINSHNGTSEICDTLSTLTRMIDQLHEIKEICQCELNYQQNVNCEIGNDIFNMVQKTLELISAMESLHKVLMSAKKRHLDQNHTENSIEDCETETESSLTSNINNDASNTENTETINNAKKNTHAGTKKKARSKKKSKQNKCGVNVCGKERSNEETIYLDTPEQTWHCVQDIPSQIRQDAATENEKVLNVVVIKCKKDNTSVPKQSKQEVQDLISRRIAGNLENTTNTNTSGFKETLTRLMQPEEEYIIYSEKNAEQECIVPENEKAKEVLVKKSETEEATFWYKILLGLEERLFQIVKEIKKICRVYSIQVRKVEDNLYLNVTIPNQLKVKSLDLVGQNSKGDVETVEGMTDNRISKRALKGQKTFESNSDSNGAEETVIFELQLNSSAIQDGLPLTILNKKRTIYSEDVMTEWNSLRYGQVYRLLYEETINRQGWLQNRKLVKNHLAGTEGLELGLQTLNHALKITFDEECISTHSNITDKIVSDGNSKSYRNGGCISTEQVTGEICSMSSIGTNTTETVGMKENIDNTHDESFISGDGEWERSIGFVGIKNIDGKSREEKKQMVEDVLTENSGKARQESVSSENVMCASHVALVLTLTYLVLSLIAKFALFLVDNVFLISVILMLCICVKR